MPYERTPIKVVNAYFDSTDLAVDELTAIQELVNTLTERQFLSGSFEALFYITVRLGQLFPDFIRWDLDMEPTTSAKSLTFSFVQFLEEESPVPKAVSILLEVTDNITPATP